LIPCTTTGWSVDAADHHLQRSLWEAILPAEALGLPAKLARVVDRLLDDPVFIQPFGSTSTPALPAGCLTGPAG
jgi:hypothetical protein